MAISPFIFWLKIFFLHQINIFFIQFGCQNQVYKYYHSFLPLSNSRRLYWALISKTSEQTYIHTCKSAYFPKKKSLQLDWIESFKIGISSVFINRTKFIMLLSITNDKDNNIVNNNEWRHLTILSKNNVCYFCTRVAMIRQNQLYIYRLYERAWKTITVTIITVLDSTTHTNERIQSQSAIKVQNRQRRRQTKRDFNRIRALW